MMKLIVENHNGSSFSIDADLWDTVLTIKHKIENSQGTPVFKQTLSLQGKFLHDHLTIFECQIPNNSRLLLSICPDDNLNQDNNDQVPQTKQSPSNPFHKFVKNQDWSVIRNKDHQDSSEGINLRALHRTMQSPLPPNSFGENIYGWDRALTTEQLSKNQNDRPVTTHKKVTRMEAKRINDESSPPKYNINWLFSPSATVGSRRNRNQVVQTEESSTSESVKEFLRILDSPVQKKMKTSPTKLTVFVQPFEETRMIPVEVNADDNVEELRKELVKMQEKGELNLPHQGYFFVLRELILIETQSFRWNLVADGDTIEIIRL